MVGLLKSAWHSVVNAVQRWDEFWFAPLDPSMLGVLRILTGLMLLYTHAIWGLRLEAFLGPDGWQDAILVHYQDAGQTPGLSFWWYVPESMHWNVHLLCMALLTLYTLGICTRVTAWMAFLITISYANRALNANFGLDQINGLLTFYLAFGPCGAAFSVDRWWELRKQRRVAAVRLQEFVPMAPVPVATARLATRLIQVHLCLLYFFAGVSKLKGEAWWNGDAVWMALANKEYQSTNLTWLAWYPWVSYLLTHVTVLWEMTFFITVWKRSLRPMVLLIGVGVHLGIGAFLGMWTFGLIMIVTYLSFVPPEFLQQIGRMFSRRTTSAVTSLPTATASATHWWPQYRNVTFTGWPFAACEPLDVDAPRVLLVHPVPELRQALHSDLAHAGFRGTAVENLTTACLFLEHNPIDAILLVGDSDEQTAEILDFRRLLIRIGSTSPVSLTMLLSGKPHDLKHSDDHVCVVGQPLFDDLRRCLLHVLCERTSTPAETETLRQRASSPFSPLQHVTSK